MIRILWIDDEIDLLTPYRIFLEQKGYEVSTSNNGTDAIEIAKAEPFDIIFLDENMPGLSGIETLEQINLFCPATPVVMITKNEEENIMDSAIGLQIADYLIKPVNPNQILLTLKKHVHKREIISSANLSSFRDEFGELSSYISDSLSFDQWTDLYRRLTRWELQLTDSGSELLPMLHSLFDDANAAFSKFIQQNYVGWIQHPDNRPLTSIDLVAKHIFPPLVAGRKILFVVIDNLRYDQWCQLYDLLSPDFQVPVNDIYLSILPTATQYARNAIFSGLTPLEIKNKLPQYWVEEGDEESKNQYERELLEYQLKRLRRDVSLCYSKFNSTAGCEEALFTMMKSNAVLCVAVLNFVDMLSHARTDNKMIRELASSQAAYRSLTRDWFQHSSLLDMFREMGARGYDIVLTTDHGTAHVNKAIKVMGDKNTSVALRYKVGKSLNFDRRDRREIFEITDPASAGLPSPNLSSSYIFASGKNFFAYPNNYNYYVSYYKDTLQHGGISLEEMLIPVAYLTRKK